MTDYNTLLASLDKKFGRAVTLDDLRALKHKHIGDWSDDDLTIIEAFQGRAARVERECARARWLTPAPAAAAPVVTTKSAEPTAATATIGGLTVDAFADVLVEEIGLIVKPLQSRLQSLEVENTQLKNRVLQLEAIEAARDEVGRVDR